VIFYWDPEALKALESSRGFESLVLILTKFSLSTCSEYGAGDKAKILVELGLELLVKYLQLKWCTHKYLSIYSTAEL
jgi:hypothetical protein